MKDSSTCPEQQEKTDGKQVLRDRIGTIPNFGENLYKLIRKRKNLVKRDEGQGMACMKISFELLAQGRWATMLAGVPNACPAAEPPRRTTALAVLTSRPADLVIMANNNISQIQAFSPT